MKIFDTHSHYDDEKYDIDREEVLKKCFDKGVSDIVLVGANLNDSIKEKELYLKYKNTDSLSKFYFSVGDHPDEILKDNPESENGVNYLNELEKVCMDENNKIIASAIGEIGLDYYGESKDDSIFEHQKKWFIVEMELARKLKLPIIVHSRDACADTLDIVKKFGKDLGGIIHCFSYEKEIAISYVNMGFYIGIGGTVTFKNARKVKETVEAIPLDMIVTETDCPYLAPTPHRGERNDSTYIKYVIEEIANIKKMDVMEVSKVLYDNANKLFNRNKIYE